MTEDVVRAIAYALSGEDVGAQPALEDTSAPELERRLADVGMVRGELAAYRVARLEAEQPWPWPVPENLRAGVSPARLQALCTLSIDALGLRTHQISRPSARMTPADQRLMADRPPHW